MTHAGGSYSCTSVAAIEAMAEQERSLAVQGAERLRQAGYPVGIVSIGSTPTALFATSLEGVTEVRAGVYTFQDLGRAGLGVCKHGEIAISWVQRARVGPHGCLQRSNGPKHSV